MKNFRFVAITCVCAMMMLLCYSAPASSQSVLDDLKNIATEAAKSATNGTLSNVLNNVIGSTTVTEKDLIGTWKYSSSSCAFQSENLLAKAGGEYAAQRIENKLNPTFSRLGISGKNTSFTLNSDKSFSANIAGRNTTGTYTFNASQQKIYFQGLLLNYSCYVTKTGSNLNFLFESSKLLSLVQTMSKFTKNTTLSTIGALAKNYKGAKLGFMLKK
jgi:hypothetical protein